MSALHQAIQEVLARERMPFEALYGCLQDRLENKKQLANALTALKAKKILARDDDGNYHLRVSGETKPAKRGGRGRRPREASPMAAAPAITESDAKGNGAFATRLEHLEREAQDALDDYLFSLANPAILTPLRAARDAAREARAQWQAKEGA